MTKYDTANPPPVQQFIYITVIAYSVWRIGKGEGKKGRRTIKPASSPPNGKDNNQ
jgi:hypothetical protein